MIFYYIGLLFAGVYLVSYTTFCIKASRATAAVGCLLLLPLLVGLVIGLISTNIGVV